MNAEVIRLTRLVFKLTQPPFILDGRLKTHFDSFKKINHEIFEMIKKGLYLDNLTR